MTAHTIEIERVTKRYGRSMSLRSVQRPTDLPPTRRDWD